jgi:hypothetical protein
MKLVTIYPTAEAYIPGVPAIEQDVTPERAAELLAYRPPAFTTAPPGEPAPEPEGPPDSEPSDSSPED